MGSLVVTIQQRIARMTAIAQQTATMQEKQAAMADYIAMMTDVDLSAIDDDDETEGMHDEQDV